MRRCLKPPLDPPTPSASGTGWVGCVPMPYMQRLGRVFLLLTESLQKGGPHKSGIWHLHA